MKKIITLLIVLAALIGLAVMLRDTSEGRLKPVQSRDKLLPGLDVNAVKKIRVKEGDKSATVALTGDIWTVAERSNYAASFDKISKLLLDLKDQKAGNQRRLGKGGWGDVKLKTPGDGKDDETGLQLELLGDGDKALATLVLGKNISSTTVGKENDFMGGGNERYARVASDGETTVWVVPNQFYDLQTRAEDWIDKTFIDVQKVKEVEVTNPTAADSWKASRKDEGSSDFTLADAKAGEELDNSKASLASLLSNASFTDVLTKDKATADFMKDAVKVKLTTFDGFTYNLQLLKKGTGSDEKHYMTVAVSADIPKERAAEKDEKPEDKKKKDDEFAAKKKDKEEKLAKDKKAEGWIYEISSYTVTNVMKKRSEILKEKAKDEAKPASGAPAPGLSIPGATAPAPVPAAPAPVKPVAPAPAPAPAPAKKPVTVTTPPVSVTTPPVAVPPAPTPPKPNEVKPPPADPLPKVEPPKADAPKPAPAPAPAAADKPKAP